MQQQGQEPQGWRCPWALQKRGVADGAEGVGPGGERGVEGGEMAEDEAEVCSKCTQLLITAQFCHMGAAWLLMIQMTSTEALWLAVPHLNLIATGLDNINY